MDKEKMGIPGFLSLQILILLKQRERQTTIKILRKYSVAAKDTQHLRVNLNNLRIRGKIRRVDYKGEMEIRRPRESDGKFLPRHYKITKDGKAYLNYWIKVLIDQETEKYTREEMETAIIEERIDLEEHQDFYKRKKEDLTFK